MIPEIRLLVVLMRIVGIQTLIMTMVTIVVVVVVSVVVVAAVVVVVVVVVGGGTAPGTTLQAGDDIKHTLGSCKLPELPVVPAHVATFALLLCVPTHAMEPVFDHLFISERYLVHQI